MKHYHRTDSLKFKAALSLIDNMKWHGNQYTLEFTEPTIPDLVEQSDTFYVALNSFANNAEEMRAVTWGLIDSTGTTVHFDNVVPDVLYFPAILNTEGKPEYFHEAIYIGLNPKKKKITTYPLSDFFTNEQTDLLITRKFPYKENMKKLAGEIVGGKFYGANRADESDRKELYTVKEAPGPYLNEYRLNNKKAWKYYIYETPEKKNANLSILEYLTEAERGYPNTASPTPLEIFSQADKGANKPGYVKLAVPAKLSKEPEFDGNMQTSSGKKKIVFPLDTPQVATIVRMAPQNADNIVKAHENYELMAWGDNGWQSLSNVYSHYNYLEFPDLPANQLYRLRNHSRGREEVPFIIQDGQPKFIYYDVMLSIPYEEFVKLDNKGWKCTASSEEAHGGGYSPGYARFAIDNNTLTFWHSQYFQAKPDYPHWIKIDTKSLHSADGFSCFPEAWA